MKQEDQLQQLEANLARIENLCQQYQEDLNQSWADKEAMQVERSALLQKSQLASTKIESLIQKLKTLETSL